ncbi:hypothetical protein F971_01764 [Acinetobacter vivianii]|uniref:Uncharacterized protein n=1 Tax=Acinetobacter vivianii TaxID=1776742 RepID=N8WBU6_9GAMM|nr:hypothetical protein F971_01764 [Acinetobacter vivianii]
MTRNCLKNNIWNILKERMKTEKEHRVLCSQEPITLLK